MRLQALFDLLGKAVRPACPLKRHAGERACHRVIDVTCQSAVDAEGEHNMRTKLAYAQHEFPCDLVEVGAVELAVREVEHFTVADVQQLARGGKFRAAQFG